MGYDMYVVSPDEADVIEVELLRTEFYEAAKVRDLFERGTEGADEAQRKVAEVAARMDRADKTYFRLNIWGMGHCREHMNDLGMLITDYETPPWPDEPEDMRVEAYDLWDEGKKTALTPGERKYLEEYHALKSWSVPDTPGMPVHKFGSNDGWHVTPLEIAGALSFYRSADPAEVDRVVKETSYEDSEGNWWVEWIEWLEYAEKHGGFQVW